MHPSDKTKTRVGAVTLATVCGVALFSVAFGGLRFGSVVSFEVEFDHVGALREGADVQIAGRVVGEVRSISLAKKGATAHVELDADYSNWAPENAEIFVASKGLLSNRYIEIGPPPGGAEPGAPIRNGQILRGIAPVRVEVVVLRSIENTKRFRELLIELRPAVKELVTELDALRATLEEIEDKPGRFASLRAGASALLDEIAQARETLAAADVSVDRIADIAAKGSKLAASITAVTRAVSKDIELLAADLARFQDAASAETLVKVGIAIARFEKLSLDYQKTAEAAAEIMAAIDRGEGTVGGLLHDPEFIDEAKKLGRIIKRQPWRLFGTNRQKIQTLEP